MIHIVGATTLVTQTINKALLAVKQKKYSFLGNEKQKQFLESTFTLHELSPVARFVLIHGLEREVGARFPMSGTYIQGYFGCSDGHSLVEAAENLAHAQLCHFSLPSITNHVCHYFVIDNEFWLKYYDLKGGVANFNMYDLVPDETVPSKVTRRSEVITLFDEEYLQEIIVRLDSHIFDVTYLASVLRWKEHQGVEVKESLLDLIRKTSSDDRDERVLAQKQLSEYGFGLLSEIYMVKTREMKIDSSVFFDDEVKQELAALKKEHRAKKKTYKKYKEIKEKYTNLKKERRLEPAESGWISRAKGLMEPLSREMKEIEAKINALVQDANQSSLVRQAVEAIKPVKMDIFTVKLMLHMLEDSDRIHAERGTQPSDVHKARQAAEKARLTKLLNNLEGNEEGSTFGRFRSSYVPQASGRVTEVGGILQGASNETRALLLHGTGAVNYDLKKSQLEIARFFLQQAGKQAPVLSSLIEGDTVYSEVAPRCYMDKASFKAIVFSVVMGAKIDFNPDVTHNQLAHLAKEGYACVFQACIDRSLELKKQKQKVSPMEIYRKVRSELTPLYEEMKLLHSVLVDGYAAKNLIIEDRVVENYLTGEQEWVQFKSVKNTLGRRFEITHYDMEHATWVDMEESELKRKFTAFMLQGEEARFIHTLTVLSDQFGFEVWSNQHDGLVTDREIPQEAIELAKKMCDMPYACLEIKPF